MKLHSYTIAETNVYQALADVKAKGRVTPDIRFVVFEHARSRRYPYAYLIQLGTYDKTTGPTNSRHYKNSGQYGATSEWRYGESVWAATWDEWGWFIAELLHRDPDAKFGDYKDLADFDRKTDYRFMDIGDSQ